MCRVLGGLVSYLDEPLWSLNLASGGFVAAPPLIGGGVVVRNLLTMKDTGFDPWVRYTPGGRNGNPLQYSFLGNFLDSGT